MARDKRKDDQMFNCAQKHEHDYVVNLYHLLHRQKVSEFLTKGCINNVIRNCSHKKVYELIKQHLGYSIPD